MTVHHHKSTQSISRFFNQLFTSTTDANEGLLWLAVWPTDGSLTSDSFNGIFRRLVIPKILKDEEISSLWHLRNSSPAARGGNVHNNHKPEHGGPCVLAVRVRDVDMLWTSRTLRNLRTPNRAATFDTQAKAYRLIQRFEGK